MLVNKYLPGWERKVHIFTAEEVYSRQCGDDVDPLLLKHSHATIQARSAIPRINGLVVVVEVGAFPIDDCEIHPACHVEQLLLHGPHGADDFV